MRDPVSVSLLVPSSEMEATPHKTMVAAATSATETRYRSTPSAGLRLSIRSLEVDVSPTLRSSLSSIISLAQVKLTKVSKLRSSNLFGYVSRISRTK